MAGPTALFRAACSGTARYVAGTRPGITRHRGYPGYPAAFSPRGLHGYCVAVIALLLAAVAVGLSNLAAAIGIGVTGVNARVRLQVGLVFGVFEAGMPVVG